MPQGSLAPHAIQTFQNDTVRLLRLDILHLVSLQRLFFSSFAPASIFYRLRLPQKHLWRPRAFLRVVLCQEVAQALVQHFHAVLGGLDVAHGLVASPEPDIAIIEASIVILIPTEIARRRLLTLSILVWRLIGLNTFLRFFCGLLSLNSIEMIRCCV